MKLLNMSDLLSIYNIINKGIECFYGDFKIWRLDEDYFSIFKSQFPYCHLFENSKGRKRRVVKASKELEAFLVLKGVL